MPRGSTHTDWEVELGVVIGQDCKYVSEEDALDYVAGYCVVNDVSERHFQTKLTGQWTKGKSCDTFGPTGPWLVTRDEVGDPQNLAMYCDVNGKRMQTGNTSTMIFTVAQCISHLSQLMTLQPGDIISTGTPPGVGMGMKPEPVYLKDGDVMELVIDKLGASDRRCAPMAKVKLLQIGGITDRMRDALAPHFDIDILFDHDDRDAFLREHGADYPAILTNGHWGVPEDVAAATPNLKVVSSYGVGYDAIDADAYAERGIKVAHTPDVLNDEVANTFVMLWLAVSRELIPSDRHARSGAWEAEGNFPLTRTVQNRRVGILGLGRIGQTIADRCEAFGAEIHYHSRSKKDVPYTYHDTAKDCAAAVEVLVAITPGGPETQHMVNAEVLGALGPDGFFINVARGSVCDEAALVEALQDGKIAGAGLDVFEEEPKIPDALKAMDNVVLTPHVASGTHETRQAMGDLVVENLMQWLKDGTVKTPVPECRHL